MVSVTQDIAGNFVLLNLQRGQKLPAPVIHYLPGPDGEIMTADFSGTVLCSPAACLRFRSKPIKRMNIGQWQASPPIVRVTFTAASARAFKELNFRCVKGSLAVELTHREMHTAAYAQPHVVRQDHVPAAGSTLGRSHASATMPPTAPDRIAGATSHVVPAPERAPVQRAAAADPNQPLLRGPIILSTAPDAKYLPIEALAKTDPVPAGGSPPPQAGSLRSSKSGLSPAATMPAATMPGATVVLRGNQAPVLTVEPSAQTRFKTFRLHNPERYVVDMDGIDWGKITIPPAPADNRYIKGLRIGSPEGNPNIARLVVDLPSEKVGVVQEPGPKENELTLAFGEQDGDEEQAASLRSQGSEEQPESPASVRAQSERPVPEPPAHAPPGAVVVLDAGHGGSDPGAQRGDIQEKEITLEIVEKLKSVLAGRGVRVKLTRSDDTFVSLEDRVRITNDVQPTAFVSVHINSLETNTATTGIETYFQNDASRDLAQLIHTSLVKELGAPDRNVRKARFYVINHTPVPAILAEVGFISNKEERDKLSSSEYQEHIAEALADGVMLYLAARPPDAPQTAATAVRRHEVGTISALPPSSAGQSFTQNLQSNNPGNNPPKAPEKHAGRGFRAKHHDEQRKPHSLRQSLKFKKIRFASTRS
ncbi:MAG TPA: N-acetylmuramoyl-L-alanine amidase [Candidatus Obscuribacterales bacterium]